MTTTSLYRHVDIDFGVTRLALRYMTDRSMIQDRGQPMPACHYTQELIFGRRLSRRCPFIPEERLSYLSSQHTHTHKHTEGCWPAFKKEQEIKRRPHCDGWLERDSQLPIAIIFLQHDCVWIDPRACATVQRRLFSFFSSSIFFSNSPVFVLFIISFFFFFFFLFGPVFETLESQKII